MRGVARRGLAWRVLLEAGHRVRESNLSGMLAHSIRKSACQRCRYQITTTWRCARAGAAWRGSAWRGVSCVFVLSVCCYYYCARRGKCRNMSTQSVVRRCRTRVRKTNLSGRQRGKPPRPRIELVREAGPQHPKIGLASVAASRLPSHGAVRAQARRGAARLGVACLVSCLSAATTTAREEERVGTCRHSLSFVAVGHASEKRTCQGGSEGSHRVR